MRDRDKAVEAAGQDGTMGVRERERENPLDEIGFPLVREKESPFCHSCDSEYSAPQNMQAKFCFNATDILFEKVIASNVQSYSSLLIQSFLMFFRASCEGLPGQYHPISQGNFPKHNLQILATDGINSSVYCTFVIFLIWDVLVGCVLQCLHCVCLD